MRFPQAVTRTLAAVGVATLVSLTACGPLGGGSGPAAAPTAHPTGPSTAPTLRTPVPAAAAVGAPASAAEAAKITALARYVVLTDTDPNTLCTAKLSAKFVATVFRSTKNCRQSFSPDNPANRTKDATVSDIRVSGPAATATVTEIGGEWAGARGTWAFLRDGDQWRVAAWGVDYLRSGFTAQWGAAYRLRGDGDLIDDPAVRACVGDRFQKRSDAAFTDLAFGMFRSDKTALRTYSRYHDECELVPGADGLSPLRRTFETGIRLGAEHVGNGAVAPCVARHLRMSIPDRDLQKWINSGGTVAGVPGWMSQRIAQAGEACAAAPGSAARST